MDIYIMWESHTLSSISSIRTFVSFCHNFCTSSSVDSHSSHCMMLLTLQCTISASHPCPSWPTVYWNSISILTHWPQIPDCTWKYLEMPCYSWAHSYTGHFWLHLKEQCFSWDLLSFSDYILRRKWKGIWKLDFWNHYFYNLSIHRNSEARLGYSFLDMDQPPCDLGFFSILCIFLILLGRNYMAILETTENVFHICSNAVICIHMVNHNSSNICQPFPWDAQDCIKECKKKKYQESESWTAYVIVLQAYWQWLQIKEKAWRNNFKKLSSQDTWYATN